MKLIIFNGSPRGKKSNASVVAKWITEGAARAADIEHEQVYLANTKEHHIYVNKLLESDMALITFPLYTDSMPGIVAAFIEELQPFAGKLKGKKLGFEVHSGFPEAYHSRHVERYLVRLTQILGTDYLGTIIKGESEAMRLMPESMQKKSMGLYNRLGESMVTDGTFDSGALAKLAKAEKLSGLTLVIYKLADRIGLLSMYFKNALKKNNMLENSYARPYESKEA
jgi:hypothetical protein